MNPRTRTIGSFFTVAMAAMLVGAVLRSQSSHPVAAQSRAAAADSTTGAPKVTGGHFTFDTFKDVARQQTKAVVNISTSKVVKRQRGSDLHDFFGDDLMDRFFGGGGPEKEKQTSLGSGFIVDKDGYILTNRHVVEGADQITVTLSDNKRYEGKMVGKDARTDVALVKIEPKEPMTYVELGDSDKVEVGEWVMAIGNPFGLGGNSATVGIVSYKGRPLPLGVQGTSVNMIQTDASINPGNSGGPLINMAGQVIGINTMIITRGLPQSSGVGFAVPINVARDILPQLRSKGKVVRGWLGVQVQSVDEEMARTFKLKQPKGALVTQVTSGSPAEKAGVKDEDVIVRADNHEVEDNSDLTAYISSKAPGAKVDLHVLRGGSEKTITITLGTFPEEDEQAEGSAGRKGRLGMTLRDLSPDLAERLDMPRGAKGAVVMEVEPGEAADNAGLQRGDVIVSVNGRAVEDVDGFEAEVAKAKADGLARLRVRRGGSYTFLVLNLR